MPAVTNVVCAVLLTRCVSGQFCTSYKTFQVPNCHDFCPTTDPDRMNRSIAKCYTNTTTSTSSCMCLGHYHPQNVPGQDHPACLWDYNVISADGWLHTVLWSIMELVWLYNLLWALSLIALKVISRCGRAKKLPQRDRGCHSFALILLGIDVKANVSRQRNDQRRKIYAVDKKHRPPRTRRRQANDRKNLCQQYLEANYLLVAKCFAAMTAIFAFVQNSLFLLGKPGYSHIHLSIKNFIPAGYIPMWIASLFWFLSTTNLVFQDDDNKKFKTCVNIGIVLLYSEAILILIINTFWPANVMTDARVSVFAIFIIYGVIVVPAVFMATIYLLNKRLKNMTKEYAHLKHRPVLITKLNVLDKVLTRYFYASVAMSSVLLFVYTVKFLCIHDLGPWEATLIDLIQEAANNIYFALTLATFEGRLIPAFPSCKICSRTYDFNSLDLTNAGAALALLKKYNLSAQKYAAVSGSISENLLSHKPLKVSNVNNYNLWDSVQYFLDNSAKENDEAFAAGTTVISNVDQRILKKKTESCIGWASDPDRQAIESVEDITDDEAAAIMLYTQETVLYKELNSSLRTLNEVKLRALLPYLQLLLRALHKLPLVHMQVFRGVKLDLSDTYNAISESFVWWAFSSTTQQRHVLELPMYLGQTGPRTLFIIDAVGVDVSAFSAFPKEAEILMFPGVELEIVNKKQIEAEFWEYQIRVKLNDDTKLATPLVDLVHPAWDTFDCEALVNRAAEREVVLDSVEVEKSNCEKNHQE